MPTALLPRPVPNQFKISCGFGVKGDSWKLGYHPGVDFAAPEWTDIFCMLDGKVQMSGLEPTFGKRIWVVSKHPTLGLVRILYAHCAKLLVNAGDAVTAGLKIAKSGNTGTRRDGKQQKYHLHVQLEKWPSREILKPEFYPVEDR